MGKSVETGYRGGLVVRVRVAVRVTEPLDLFFTYSCFFALEVLRAGT